MEKKDLKAYIKDTSTPVKFIKGVGDVRAKQLAKIGINTVMDLFEYFPRNYIHRKIEPAIFELNPGDSIAMTTMISWVNEKSTRNGKYMLNVGVSDGHSTLICTWFNYPKDYSQKFKPGNLLWVSGTLSEYNGQLQLMHPEIEFVDEEEESDFWKKRAYLPVYPLTGNLTQKFFRRIIYNAFEEYADKIEENLPASILAKYGFLPRKIALQKMHFSLHPEELDSIHKRFVYEEFFYSQLLWARHKHYHKEEVKGIRFENKRQLTAQLYHKLPFKLTKAQIRVINEIFSDMTSDKQMSRLLQGDVGSGKTIVTLFAMLLAVENGYQAVLMAPTEILADQHYNNITKLLEGLPVKVALLKGGTYKGKEQTKTDIREGNADIIIGTHALFQREISFDRLGFAAIDEQHRFGVQQRARLAKKHKHPDLLYLSATPIPRSLSLTVYGDLEVSIIDELPPNRIPVTTLIRSSHKIELVYKEVAKELEKGRQVYIVCPLIEESDKVDLLDAKRMQRYISTKIFPQYSCVLIHGKMSSKEKEDIMRRFKAGDIKILVSTTVIEVGLDIPNATVMIVEHAERFGLAQLHQLRGRVGRGSDQAYCYLIEHLPATNIAKERLATLASTTDGFLIAEKDLELRGPGEIFGTEQSGMPHFKFANLVSDQPILNLARKDAFQIIAQDPELKNPENKLIKNTYFIQFAEKEKLILY
ncbi:MAG: ATP-dependent DNA helicase RecG [Candidatus Cloacimonetes bacterium ADurb.Bin211]|nr:MAG: ATP-dependent DNA helicase RecG [Candidatus Cloacimonetes bacterium ADurb.Bin211]